MTAKLKLLGVSLGMALALMLLTWVFRLDLASAYFRYKYYKASPERSLARNWAQFSEDQEILSKHAFFTQSTGGTRDAGIFLNPKIRWATMPEYRVGTITLTGDLIREAEKRNRDWLEWKPDFARLGLDLRWFQRIHAFDHWNIATDCPALEKGKHYSIHELPEPSLGELRTWARLRFLSVTSRNPGEVAQALRDVRQLAWLTWTQDSVIAAMAAISILKTETEFVASLGSSAPKWIPIPHEDLERARRHFYSYAQTLDPRLETEAWNKAASLPAGRCLRISEGIRAHLSLRDLLLGELAASFNRMDGVVKETDTQCSLGTLRVIWKDPRYPAVFADNMPAFGLGARILGDKTETWGQIKAQPKLRRLAGYFLGALRSPDHFTLYERGAK